MAFTPLTSSSGAAGSSLGDSFVCTWDAGENASWVHLAGELDLAGTPRLESTLDEAQRSASLVVLDPRGLTFIDCAGIHTILESAARARHRGGWLMLMVASPIVERMLGLTGRHDLVTVFDVELGLELPSPEGRARRGRRWRPGVLRSASQASQAGPPQDPQLGRHRGLRAVQDNAEDAPSPSGVRRPAWSRSTPGRDHATMPSSPG